MNDDDLLYGLFRAWREDLDRDPPAMVVVEATCVLLRVAPTAGSPP
ncbi:hypothetical protein [Actinokineospora sp. HUAS TT18]